MNRSMKISLAAAALILAAAGAIASREDRRITDMKTRLEQRTASVAAARTAAHRERADLDEEAERVNVEETAAIRNSALELLEWMRQFQDPKNPGRNPDPEKMDEMNRLLEKMTATQAAFILGEFAAGRGINGFPGPLLVATGLTKLAGEFPLAAIHFVEVLEKQGGGAAILKEIGVQVIGDAVIAMAKNDPRKAIAWLKDNGARFENHITPNTKHAMLFNIARCDPALAFDLIPELGGGDEGFEVAAIVRAAGTDDERRGMLSSLREYLGTQPDGPGRQGALLKAFDGFVDRLGDEGVAGMDRWLASVKLSPAEMDALVDGVGGWARYRPDGEWVGWLAKTATPGTDDEGLHAAFTRWAEADYRVAGDWLSTAPQGNAREVAVRAYAEAAAKYDPEAAAQWAESLPAGERRQDTLRKVYEDWRMEEPGDAAAKAAFAKKNGL